MGAFPNPFDYSSAAGWSSQLELLTQHLFGALFILELVILGVQALFFKDSVYEYFKMFAGKILLATVVLAVIANANLIFPQAVSIFAATANAVIGGNGGGGTPPPSQACVQHMRWTCVPPSASNNPEGTFLEWAMFYFIAADASRVADSAEGIASGIMFGIPFPPDPGDGDPGISTTFLMGHGQFQIVCFGLGMLCVISAATIFLTYVLLTFEMQIILAIGVITMAGYGTRFTQSMSAAFPKYCVTIGTKFFAYYFVVAAVQVMVSNVSNSFSGTGGLLGGLIGGALVPFGALAIALVFASSTVPIIAVVSAILVAAIPGFAGSLTQGGAALSAGDGLKSTVSQFKG
jgi:hypothetical protein